MAYSDEHDQNYVRALALGVENAALRAKLLQRDKTIRNLLGLLPAKREPRRWLMRTWTWMTWVFRTRREEAGGQ